MQDDSSVTVSMDVLLGTLTCIHTARISPRPQIQLSASVSPASYASNASSYIQLSYHIHCSQSEKLLCAVAMPNRSQTSRKNARSWRGCTVRFEPQRRFAHDLLTWYTELPRQVWPSLVIHTNSCTKSFQLTMISFFHFQALEMYD